MNNLTNYQRAMLKTAFALMKTGEQMRKAQKGYTKIKDPQVLKTKKLLEREFDRHLKEMRTHQDANGQLVMDLFKQE